MVKLSSALLLVLSVAAVHAIRHGIGYGGKNKGVGSLATLGLGYGLGHAFDHGLYGNHPTGLYYAPTYGVGHGHHHGYYHGHPNHYAPPKHGFHLGYEIGYQGKLGFVKLKRDNLRQVQFSFGLGKPSAHHKA